MTSVPSESVAPRNEFWQLVVTVETAPNFLGLDKR